MIEENKKGEVAIYKTEHGPDIQVNFEGDTAWLSLQQIADLFGRDKSVISRHITNVFNSAELSRNSVVAKIATTASDGKVYQVDYYNLDMIFSVGYRVNSKRGTQFRIWATSRLRDFLVKGFAVDEKRLKDFENMKVKMGELERAHKLMQTALAGKKLLGYEKELLQIITDYADTWFLLSGYDSGKIKSPLSLVKPKKTLSYDRLKQNISKFKERLNKEKQASELFGNEIDKKFEALLGNIDQSFDGKPLYESLHSKAAHLLYFCIKDHPFADGNKRIGSLTFLLYLVENDFLFDKKGERKINDNTLTALALLVAESRPEDKNILISLIENLIR